MGGRVRDDIILDGLNLACSTVLEIAPLHRPLVEKDLGKVYYADHLCAEGLREKYATDPVVSKALIPTIDFVVGGDGSLVSAASAAAPFDAIVASHVIEHVPDLIAWLKETRQLLATGGRLCLAVPDKRFTFDVLRRPTRYKDVAEAHAERRWRPSLDTVCDSYRNVAGVIGEQLWAGVELEKLEVGWRAEVVDERIKQHLAGEYVDVHCWVFTPSGFLSLLCEILVRNEIGYEVVLFETTRFNEEEFFVQLRACTFGPSVLESFKGFRSSSEDDPRVDALIESCSDPALRSELVAMQSKLREIERALEDSDRRLAAIHNSNSWRITSPLRRLRRSFAQKRSAA